MAARSDPTDAVTKKLADLLQWLAAKADILHQQRPVGGDTESVKQQLEVVQVYCSMLIWLRCFSCAAFFYACCCEFRKIEETAFISFAPSDDCCVCL
jgi:hypothetical protein